MRKQKYTRQKSKESNETNNEKLKVYFKDYYEINKETKQEYNKDYNETNKEKINEQKKQYREANKEKINEKKRGKISCECNCEVLKQNIKQHQRTKKHISLIQCI